MSRTPFLITIDTEGDNLWENPLTTTTRNAIFLPRFQSLCERFKFKPVYLVNYEMAQSPIFIEFAKDVLARKTGEIGMHLHAWNSPPLTPLTSNDLRHHPYLIEYPDAVMKEKIKFMTRLLEDKFDRPVISHRAGRWAFDERYAAMLLDEGYRVDCSVTPGVDWSGNPGAPWGKGGSNYSNFPSQPYFLNPKDISTPASDGLLEVPMTTLSSKLYRAMPWIYRFPILRQAAQRLSPRLRWLCPTPLLEKNNLRAILDLARAERNEGAKYLEFMLHSSELMPGGSPSFEIAEDIERLYDVLEILFEEFSQWCYGVTLEEFHSTFRHSSASAIERTFGNAVPNQAAAQLG